MNSPKSPTHDSARDPVFAALRELPRDQASPGFTTAVLRRLAQPEEPAFWSRPALATAAVALVLTAAGAGLWEQRARARDEMRGEVQALRQEHQALEDEIKQLHRASAEVPAVVYLGGDEKVDFVWNLNEAAHPATRAATARRVDRARNHS